MSEIDFLDKIFRPNGEVAAPTTPSESAID